MTQKQDEVSPEVSVIIPTKNSASTLGRVLDAVNMQTYPSVQAIIVDRFSKDGTPEIARSKGADVYQLDAERSASVNFGVNEAKSKYIYYIGSDYLLDPEVISASVTAAEKTHADAVIVPNLVDTSQGYWSRVRGLAKSSYVGDPMMEAARFFRRDTFVRLGGYNPDFVAYEEHDLHNRFVNANAKIVRVDGVKELHIDEPQNLVQVARKFHYYGKTAGRYAKRYPKLARIQLTPLRPAYIRNWRLFATHPSLTVGFFAYQTVRFAAAGIGYLQARSRP